MLLTRLRGLVALAVALVIGLTVVAIAGAQSTAAPKPVPSAMKVGVLKLTSSAPIFVGVEKGFFKEFGVEPELVYFQAAAPIATALAAGQLDVGATGLTAALYNIVLGGEKLWIVADKGREWPGYPLVAIVVQKEAWDGGLRSIKDLRGKRIGVTQLGSTFHYHIGNILEKDGLRLSDVKIVPLQAMAATVEALKGKQVDAILVPQPFPGAAEAQGFGKILAWAGDLYPWQIATVFYSDKLAADRARAVAFMKGYVKASRYYFDAALVQKRGPRGQLRRGRRDHRPVHRGPAGDHQARVPLPGPERAAAGSRHRATDELVGGERVHEEALAAQGPGGHLVRGGGGEGARSLDHPSPCPLP
jgi:NitT/TauT family transport system substrate-binding protein